MTLAPAAGKTSFAGLALYCLSGYSRIAISRLFKGEQQMPLVKVEIYKGKSPQYKKALLNSIHAALVTAFKIPLDDRNQRLYELDNDHFERRRNKSIDFTIIEITAFKGRSLDAKKLLYKEINTNLSKYPGIDGKDILIILNEQPLENWGIYGGKPASEVDLGFDVEV